MSDVDEKKQIIDDDELLSQSDIEKNLTAEELRQSSGKIKNKTMMIKVHAPFKSYFDGPAFSISAENLVGPFDILPGHHNFITLLEPCEINIRSSEGNQRIHISGGIMHVKADEVIVFLDV